MHVRSCVRCCDECPSPNPPQIVPVMYSPTCCPRAEPTPPPRAGRASPHSGVAKRAVFQKGGFGGFGACSPGTKTGTRVHSDVPPERKPERGYVRMFPRNEKPERGYFRQTTLLRNCPFVSSRHMNPPPILCWHPGPATRKQLWDLPLGRTTPQELHKQTSSGGPQLISKMASLRGVVNSWSLSVKRDSVNLHQMASFSVHWCNRCCFTRRNSLHRSPRVFTF